MCVITGMPTGLYLFPYLLGVTAGTVAMAGMVAMVAMVGTVDMVDMVDAGEGWMAAVSA